MLSYLAVYKSEASCTCWSLRLKIGKNATSHYFTWHKQKDALLVKTYCGSPVAARRQIIPFNPYDLWKIWFIWNNFFSNCYTLLDVFFRLGEQNFITSQNQLVLEERLGSDSVHITHFLTKVLKALKVQSSVKVQHMYNSCGDPLCQIVLYCLNKTGQHCKTWCYDEITPHLHLQQQFLKYSLISRNHGVDHQECEMWQTLEPFQVPVFQIDCYFWDQML